MEQPNNFQEDLFSKVKDYINVRAELLRLKVVDKISFLFSTIVSYVLFSLIVMMVIVLLSIGLSLYLGQVFGSVFLGFFAVGGIYLVLAIILVLLRRFVLKLPLRNWIIKTLLD